MRKKYLFYVTVFSLFSIVLLIWYWRAKPNVKLIERNTDGWYAPSEVSHPENYKKLVRLDLRDNKTFLTQYAWYCIVVSNSFPFAEKQYHGAATQEIIEILNDSSSYRWGEHGTPDIDRTIIYYGKIDEPVGYTEIDLDGEVENYPYRSSMKWGMLTKSSMEKLMNILDNR